MWGEGADAAPPVPLSRQLGLLRWGEGIPFPPFFSQWRGEGFSAAAPFPESFMCCSFCFVGVVN